MRHYVITVGIAVATMLWAATAGFAQNGAPMAPTAPFTAGSAATVQPGDRISVAVWGEPEMAGTFLVTEDGNVVLPKLGVVQVTRRSVAQLQDSLRRAYAAFIRSPVEIEVLRRISVQGEVNKPDLYMVDLTMTLRDVIAKAGGLTGGGDPNKVYILRGDSTIRVGEGGNGIFLATELRSGDQIVVGSRSWISRNSLALTGTAFGLVGIIISIINTFGSD
jgi:protein involved in polysaccharide export with SLBB domain